MLPLVSARTRRTDKGEVAVGRAPWCRDPSCAMLRRMMEGDYSGLWLLVLLWVAFYWGTVFLVGGLIAWNLDRRARIFLLGAGVSIGIAVPLWGPWVPADSGTAITIGWLAGALVGVVSRIQRRRARGRLARG